MTWWRALRWEAQAVVFTVACLAGAASLVWVVTVVHAARDAEQRICRMQIELVKTRNVFAQRFVCAADPCECAKVVSR